MIGKVVMFSAALLVANAAAESKSTLNEADVLDGFVETGRTVNCVPMRSASIDAIDENRLLFKVGSRYYLNETSGSCERAGSSFNRIEVKLFGPRACRGEIMRVVDNRSGMFEGACSLGSFRELERKPKEEAVAEPN